MARKMLDLKPVKMWINGKIFVIESKPKRNHKKNIVNLIQNNQSQIFSEEHLSLLNIREVEGKFATNLKLPSIYRSKIQNSPSFDIKKVSEITRTKICMSAPDQITLTSDSTEHLAKAAIHVYSAISEIRNQCTPLQFICIPCLAPNIRERFENFKREVLNMEQEIDGLHESIFVCPLKLHLTIDVFTLISEEEKAEAIKALEEYKIILEQLFLKTGPLRLDIGTLDCMSTNLKKVDVLYANVKLVNETPELNLQTIVNGISTHFYDRGLAKRYQENVKLHMTLINTKYRKNSDIPKKKRRRLSIDATKIMEKFKGYTFGHCDLNSVHLSHITLKGEDGFYKPLTVITCSQNS